MLLNPFRSDPCVHAVHFKMNTRKRNNVLVLLLPFVALLRAQAMSPVAKQPVRRSAVIGGGISGLSVAHALQQRPGHEISIFESRKELDHISGAGIQVNGGLAVLDKIRPDLRRKVQAAGAPLTGIQSRCKSWFGDPAERKYSTLFSLDLKKIVQGSEKYASLLDGDDLLFISIMRGTLQKILYENLPE